MTDEQKEAAVGRVLLEYGKVKSDLMAVYSEAERLGERFSGMAKYLQNHYGEHSKLRKGSPIPFKAEAVPSGEKVVELCEEGLKLRERLTALRADLKELGFEPQERGLFP